MLYYDRCTGISSGAADNVNIKGGTAGIQLPLSREGRPSGECYVEVCSEADLEAALKKHNNNMGHRYVEGKLARRWPLSYLTPL